MRVVVTGGRDNNNLKAIWATLDEVHNLYPITLLIWGGARGVDRICAKWADARKVNHLLMPARWKEDGRAAGFIRNKRMLSFEGVSMLIAFHGGKGTAHTVDTAKKMGLDIWYQDDVTKE